MKSSDVQRMIADIEDFLGAKGEDHKGRRAAGSLTTRWQRQPMWSRPTFVVVLVLALILGATFVATHQGIQTNDGTDRASAAAAGPGYLFLATNRSGTPVRWDPCTEIGYVTNLTSAPSYAASDLDEALGQIAGASGLVFVDEGSTTDFPIGGPVIQPANGQPEVEIAWASPAQSSDMTAALGPELATVPARSELVAAMDEITGHGLYVAGSIIVAGAAASRPEGFGSGSLGSLWLYELGRLVGLGDSASSGEIMNPTTLSTQIGLGSGDLAGLRRLGRQSGCLSRPTNPSYEPVI